MAIVINKIPKEGFKYTPRNQVGNEDAFSVWVKPLDTRNLLNLEDRMVQRENDNVIIAQGMYSFHVAQQGIVEWENILDHDGSKLSFKFVGGIASEETIASIPADLITEIASVISVITRDPSQIQIFFPED